MGKNNNLLISLGVIFLAFLFLAFSVKPSYAKKEDAKTIAGKEYISLVQKQIKKQWHPPKNKTSNKVKVLFVIDKNGNLISHEIKKSSGNEKIDEAAIEAIKKAAPFPKVPDVLSEKSVTVDFDFDYKILGSK